LLLLSCLVKASSRILKNLITQELIISHGVINFSEEGRDYSRTRGIAIDFPATKKDGRSWYYQFALSHFLNWQLLHRSVENNSPLVLQQGNADCIPGRSPIRRARLAVKARLFSQLRSRRLGCASEGRELFFKPESLWIEEGKER